LILDLGGGPGRYTIELARKGYEVILFDLTPANLEFARRQIKRIPERNNVKKLIEGSITDLSQFEDQTFAAVVCTGGPLSHVVDRGQREQAISELVRVAKPEAPIFVSVMSRLSVLINELTLFQHEIEMPHFKPLRDTGDYFGGTGFTACHFFLPEELREAFENQPVTVLEMVGLEGINSNHRKKLNQVAKDPNRWKIWLETHYATCTHPAVVGMSEHILLICRKLASVPPV
jgi:SAM-dependent methyltransferase